MCVVVGYACVLVEGSKRGLVGIQHEEKGERVDSIEDADDGEECRG
jgi:hypothetical protein